MAEEMNSNQQPGDVVSTDTETESEVRSLKREIAFLKHKSAVQELEIKYLQEQQNAMNNRLRAQRNGIQGRTALWYIIHHLTLETAKT